MERHCLQCGKAFHGRSDKKFCCDDCRTDYHNEQRRIRERQLREVNSILAANWRILSAELEDGRTRTSVTRLAARNFNFEIYTASRRRFPLRRTFWCYNYAYRVSMTGIVRIFPYL